jgi:serine/threonine protein kinase
MVENKDTQICPGCFTEGPALPKCPQCGFEAGRHPHPQALPPGMVLNGHFLVGKVLGKPGGFGMTYLAWDNTLETRVAIKEFLPHELVGRDRDHLSVVAHSQEDHTIFRAGLNSFLQEARTLARFNHPNIVRVRHFFQENGTAYMVMDYYQGHSLWEGLESKSKPFSEAESLDIVLPILEGLREIHDKGFVHRDIKPQNIYLTRDGRPILLDFGAARNAIGERSHSLSVVWTPGFAPFEQYQNHGKQGPWTDVYGVSATLYFMVTGRVPPDAMERKANAEALSLAGLTPALGAALSKGLAVDRQQRPQTIEEFRDLLTIPSAKPPQSAEDPPEIHRPIPPSPAPPENQTGLNIALYGGLFAIFFFVMKGVLMTPPDALSDNEAIPAALVASGFGTLIYWAGVYVMYRIGRKFSIGSIAGFTIPIYNTVLLCRCAGLSGWLIPVLFIPYIGAIIFPVWLYGAIARRLGKSFWLYGLGSLFLVPILILAFDDSRPEAENVPDYDETRDSTDTAVPPISMQAVTLHFLSGDFEGESLPVPSEGIIIGRNPAASNIVFSDTSISGRHLRISFLQGTGTKVIEDLGSTNGTFFSFTAPPTDWQPLRGTLRETGNRTVWIRIAERGPILKIS